jgi:Zn-dependent peptidase ImmA (M78 family)
MASRTDEQATSVATQLLVKLASSYVEVEQLLGRPLVTRYPPERPLQRKNLDAQAEDRALELRNSLGLGLRPIEDLIWIAESEMAIRVFERPLPSQLSEAFIFEPTAGACIVLNRKHPRLRRVMSLAHGLGHFVTNRQFGEVLGDSGTDDDFEERFATQFAAALLMPAAALRLRYEEASESDGNFTPRSLVYLARSFYVTVEAMCRRLEHLELLEAGTYEVLRRGGLSERMIQQTMGELPPTHGGLPAPRRFGLLVSEAYEKGLLSEEQASDMLALPRVEVRELFDAISGGDGFALGSEDA